MKEIGDLGLTLKQTLEVSTYDPLLVQAWLEQVDDPDIPNPTAWFLVGVRSGVMPTELSDRRREKAIHLAERWITLTGIFVDREAEVDRELFGPGGLLHHYKDEDVLRHRMLTLWRLERPRGEDVEQEARARAERTREAMRRARA